MNTNAPETPTNDDAAADPATQFEAGMKELEALVAEMEQGGQTLEQMLDRYQRGVELTRQLETTLSRAELRIEELSKSDDEN